MDNVTHSLIGVLLARSVSNRVGSLRGALWAAILASNVPDIDIVASPVYDDRKLGGLVHHRGYTHTLLGASLLAVACAAFAARRDPRAKRGALLALALVAAWLHIGADSWNNYGVHPFWPLADRWYYGDTVFIVEPLLWLALLPLAWTTFGRPVAKGGMLALFAGMAGILGWRFGVTGVAAWGLGGAALLGAQRRWDTPRLPWVLSLLTLGAFEVGRRSAEETVRERLPTDERVLDVVLTPRPASPWCWQAFALTEGNGTYEARSGLVSLLPPVTPPGDCSLRYGGTRTAPSLSPDLPSDTAVAWGWRFEGSVEELQKLDASCRVDTMLSFARAPFWVERDGSWIVGDLRYDFEPELGFAEVDVRSGEEQVGCYAVPWRAESVTELVGE